MSSADAYTLGFYTGALLYFGLLALVFWFVGPLGLDRDDHPSGLCWPGHLPDRRPAVTPLSS